MNGTISREDKEIYVYGMQQGMIALLNLGTTILLGMVFGKLLECIVFMVAYMPLRSFAGGYHAKTAIRCYIFSIVMMSAVLWVMRYVMYSGLVCGCLTAIFGSMIWFLVPVEDRNKPLDDVEKVVYRKRARGILLFEIVIMVISLLLNDKRIAICMMMVFGIMAIMLLLGQWKNRYLRKLQNF
ncbi:MAG: accessory gene regulator B family protein [Lachnospiraceae bacterium]|nr:accessory gene regulator B family protein [Lachnospiraceae bacterium]